MPTFRLVSNLVRLYSSERDKHAWFAANDPRVDALKDKGYVVNRGPVTAACISWAGQDYWIQLLDSANHIRA